MNFLKGVLGTLASIFIVDTYRNEGKRLWIIHWNMKHIITIQTSIREHLLMLIDTYRQNNLFQASMQSDLCREVMYNWVFSKCSIHVGFRAINIGGHKSYYAMGCYIQQLQILRGTQFQGHSRRAPKTTVKNTIEVWGIKAKSESIYGHGLRVIQTLISK